MIIPSDLTPTALRTLGVLLEERHVARAADRLNLTPSAVSRILARLRLVFDDPLLIRTPSGFELTARAHALKPHLSLVFTRLEALVRTDDVAPRQFQGAVTIGLSLHARSPKFEHALLKLMDEGPGVSFQIVHLPDMSLEKLETGAVDLALSTTQGHSANLYRRALGTGEWVCVLAATHPLASAMTAQGYVEARHLMIRHSPEERLAIDHVLDGLGIRARIVLSAPSLSTTALALAERDLVVTVPPWLAELLRRMGPLTVVSLPKGLLPGVERSIFWHARIHHAPLFIWLRRRLFELLRDERRGTPKAVALPSSAAERA